MNMSLAHSVVHSSCVCRIRLYIHHTSAGTTAESSLPCYGWYILTIQSSLPSNECPTCEDICHIPFRLAMARENKCGLPWRCQVMLRVGKLSAFPGPRRNSGPLLKIGRVVCIVFLLLYLSIWVSSNYFHVYIYIIYLFFSPSICYVVQPRVPNISGIVGRHRNALFSP